MKLHDKNLVTFALSRAGIDNEGYLYKRGELNRSFQKRWFVLKGNLLFYFDKRDDKEPIGVIILENFTIDLCDDEDGHSFKVVFLGVAGREYIMRAETHELMEAWMRSISSASYEYITQMVVTLQKQMEEITAGPSTVSQLVDVGGAPPPVAPPRQRRTNPFHQTAPLQLGLGTNFRALHEELGRVIKYDRANWMSCRFPIAQAPLIDL